MRRDSRRGRFQSVDPAEPRQLASRLVLPRVAGCRGQVVVCLLSDGIRMPFNPGDHVVVAPFGTMRYSGNPPTSWTMPLEKPACASARRQYSACAAVT
jgi:hypothetical protein